MKYRPDIDALRAFAVGAVLLSHLGVTGFAGGFSGVDVFFVISGFLITNFLLERASTGKISLTEFYFRRAKRILPMALVVLLATCLAALLLLNELKFAQVVTDSYWAALFLANLHLIQKSSDYFSVGFDQSLVQHYWSLAVEEQFYLAFPLLVIGVFALAKRAGTKNSLRLLGWVVGLGALASLGWAIYQGNSDPTTAYYSSFTRSYELAIGALLAILTFGKSFSLSPRIAAVTAWVSVAAISSSFLLLGESKGFPSYLALLPTLGAAAFILSNTSMVRVPVLSGLFALRPLVFLGKISFSVYLIHWPLLVFVRLMFPEFAESWSFAPSLIAVTILLSVVGYRFVEQPVRRIQMPQFKLNLQRKIAFVTLTGVVLVGLASSSYALTGGTWNTAYVSDETEQEGPKEYLPNEEEPEPGPGPTTSASPVPGATSSPTTSPSATPTKAPKPKPTTPTVKPADPKLAALLSTWVVKVLEGLEITSVPDDLDPPISSLLRQRGVQWSQCMDPEMQKPTCTFGSPNAKYTAVILGDSYALAIYPMVIDALGLEDWQIIGLNRRECMIADVVPWSWDDKGIDRQCPIHRQWVNTYIQQIKPDLVVLSDQTFHPIADGNVQAGDNQVQIWEAGLDSSLSKLSKLSDSIVYFGLPTSHQGLVDCVKSGNQLSSRCTGNSNLRAFYPEIQADLSRKHGIKFINPNDWLCVGGSCPAIIDKTPVYWDGAHFTQTFAAKLAPLFRAFLRENGLL